MIEQERKPLGRGAKVRVVRTKNRRNRSTKPRIRAIIPETKEPSNKRRMQVPNGLAAHLVFSNV